MLLEPPMMAHCHSASKYSSPRASKRADISRLLDPTYASSSSSNSASSSSSTSWTVNQTKVYVDHDGDLHDPDYRHFPSLSRPSWEVVEEDENVFEEEEERYRSSPKAFSPRSLTRESRNLLPSFPSSRSLSPSPPFSAQIPSVSTSPSSMASDETWLSAVDSYETGLNSRHECKTRHEHKLRKRRSLGGEVDEQKLLGEESDQEDEEQTDEPCHTDSAPTCSDAMKKEWQALQLHVRIGVFRMKRRVRDSFK
ncbi:hypothetical protein C8J56DRAFT_960709 [Mycena floridula]|nr:hypothetical protein C8J56DRAFT_960709 [Mycena floridula]